jgi:hypothetical protein
MTSTRPQADRSADDASWVYLSHSAESEGVETPLRDCVVDFCETSGWHAVSWSQKERAGRRAEPGRFFEGLRHAVEHADVFVAFIGDATEMTDAELVLAYSYRRPIVGVCVSAKDSGGSDVQAMLRSYERARMIVLADVDECVSDLRATFADPAFAEVIRLAAGEHADA